MMISQTVPKALLILSLILILFFPFSSASIISNSNKLASAIYIFLILVSQRTEGGGNLVTGDGYYREYNELQQLIRVRNGSNESAPILEEYSYDPFGERIKIKRFDVANTTIYTPFKELMRIVNSSGTFDYLYVYQDNTLVARKNPDGAKWFYHPDHLGSTTLITDQNGNVVENTSYTPYGEAYEGGTKEDKLYTGQFKDDIADQYYFGSRYFDSGTIRFIQPDSYIAVYNPQSLNRYAYGLNNPYKFKDDSGNSPTLALGLAGALIGGGINLGVQLWENHGDFNKVNWGSVGVSAGSGFVAGATLGIGTAALGTGMGASIISGAAAGVAGGQTQIAGENLLEGRPITERLFEGEDVFNQAVIGGALGAFGKTTSDLFTSTGNSQFTRNNFRNNFAKETGLNPSGYDAHHSLPVKFERQFSDAGINIHNPSYGQWVERGLHQQNSYNYNQLWKNFFRANNNPNKNQIERFAKNKGIAPKVVKK